MGFVADCKQQRKRVEERLALMQREGRAVQRAWSFIHSAKHTQISPGKLFSGLEKKKRSSREDCTLTE